MSIAFESNSSSDTNRIQSQEFSDFTQRMWIYNMSDSSRFTVSNPWSSTLPVVHEEEDSSSSSSIGNNSDIGGGGSDSDEVQSKDNGTMNVLNALEEVLPVKRGISTFYAGKSKSYGSLTDASSAPSIQDIVKPEDAYSRKRKNMLAHHVLFEKHRKSTTDSGFSKRLVNSNSHNSTEIGGNSNSNSNSSIPGYSLPPLPRNNRTLPTNETSNSSSSSSSSSHRLYSSPWRSLSLSDLQQASASMSNKRGNDDEN